MYESNHLLDGRILSDNPDENEIKTVATRMTRIIDDGNTRVDMYFTAFKELLTRDNNITYRAMVNKLVSTKLDKMSFVYGFIPVHPSSLDILYPHEKYLMVTAVEKYAAWAACKKEMEKAE